MVRSGVTEAKFADGGVSSEARRVALEEARRMGRTRKTEVEGNNFDLDEDVIGLEEEVDRLPEGMSWSDLPRFEKIHGWDMDSPDLK